ncbi:MAG TPA: hypothetical protein VM327_07850 [Candidatus Thermoplasmatota archaeon]|nr:hypothetical protein [Candidatus Thermoplasmatota archaeon]
MARRLNTLNFVYTTVGIGVAAGVGYLVWRQLRNRRANTAGDNLMDFRRTTRKAGRAIKDATQQVGKSVKRGASDTAEAFEDASSSGQPLIEQDATGYNRI